jgi:hypothetical protein
MEKDGKGRVLQLPKKLWEAIDEDAKRCRRSAVKQVEAILLSYFDLEDVDLNNQALSKFRAERKVDKK